MLKSIKKTLKPIVAPLINPQAIILAYHRVFDTKNDPQLLCVSPQNFESHLKIISNYFNPMPLQKITKKFQHRSVVITFDDGYVDNLLFAKPLLEKYKIPATVFVTTHYIDKDREPWWDELGQLFLPATSTWTVEQSAKNSNQKSYLDLHGKLKSLSHKEKENTLENLRFQGARKITAEPNRFISKKKFMPARCYNRIMNQKELKKLSQSCCVEIGAHTVTHSQLSSQSLKEQIFETIQSKKTLEKIIEKPVRSFSYPFGTPNDIDPRIISYLKEHYACATANFPNLVTKKTDLFMLPRFLVRNWDGDTFYKNLNRWFYG